MKFFKWIFFKFTFWFSWWTSQQTAIISDHLRRRSSKYIHPGLFKSFFVWKWVLLRSLVLSLPLSRWVIGLRCFNSTHATGDEPHGGIEAAGAVYDRYRILIVLGRRGFRLNTHWIILQRTKTLFRLAYLTISKFGLIARGFQVLISSINAFLKRRTL